MALFFDQSWFDAQLSALGLSRVEVALALGLTQPEVDEIWKDQRELSARDVATLAQLLAASPHEIATRAGISTPVPASAASDTATAKRLDRIEATLARLESEIAQIKLLVNKT